MRYVFLDSPRYDPDWYLKRIALKINEELKQNRVVFIHCNNGISRSPCFVLAYLIQYKKMNYY